MRKIVWTDNVGWSIPDDSIFVLPGVYSCSWKGHSLCWCGPCLAASEGRLARDSGWKQSGWQNDLLSVPEALHAWALSRGMLHRLDVPSSLLIMSPFGLFTPGCRTLFLRVKGAFSTWVWPSEANRGSEGHSKRAEEGRFEKWKECREVVLNQITAITSHVPFFQDMVLNDATPKISHQLSS